MSKDIKLRLLMLVCIVSNISYYPVFVDFAYSRQIVISFWIFLGIISIKQILNLNAAEKTFFMFFAAFVIVSFLSLLSGNSGVFNNHFFSVITTAVIIFAAANLIGEDFEQEDIVLICKCYMYATTIIAVFLFFFYLVGTDIYSVVYTYQSGKNEIAVLLMAAVAIAITVYKPIKYWQRAVQMFAIIICVTDILLLKCRSVMFSLVPMIIMLILFRNKIQRRTRLFLIAVVICLTVFLFTHQEYLDILLNQFIFANNDSSSLDSISSGRMTQIEEGMSVFNDNWFLGVGSRKTLDCMYISILANYGIMCWPIILMAVSPLVWGLRELFFSVNDELVVCLVFIASGMFIVSLFEELAPFGPGTRCYILWLLWGLILGNRSRGYLSETDF